MLIFIENFCSDEVHFEPSGYGNEQTCPIWADTRAAPDLRRKTGAPASGGSFKGRQNLNIIW